MLLTRVLGFALVTCLIAHPDTGFAAKKKAKKDGGKAAPTEVQDSDEVASGREPNDGASAATRASKKYGAEVLFTPVSDFMLQFGVGGHYTLSPKIQVGFDYLTGSKDIVGEFQKTGSVEVTKATLSGMAAFAYGRYFFGNSFNAMAGLGIRNATGTLRVEDTSTKEFFESKLSISSFVMPIAIGNHWSFDNGFSIGCDWVAAFVPLSGSAKTTSSTNISDPDIDKFYDDFQKTGDSLAKTTSLTLALTSIGWQF